MTEKQRWIDDILNSAKDIQAVDANPFMATRVESKLQQPAIMQLIPMRKVYAFVLALVVLVLINITAWQYGQPQRTGNDIQQLMQEYGWVQKNTDIWTR